MWKSAYQPLKSKVIFGCVSVNIHGHDHQKSTYPWEVDMQIFTSPRFGEVDRQICLSYFGHGKLYYIALHWCAVLDCSVLYFCCTLLCCYITLQQNVLSLDFKCNVHVLQAVSCTLCKWAYMLWFLNMLVPIFTPQPVILTPAFVSGRDSNLSSTAPLQQEKSVNYNKNLICNKTA